mmetsp:Transcript_15499/g.37503  ORF Transcript_15499/g.37503 Transcript_15499/m.37503 type:complete len:458 (-) Transcript_15499:2131-3504(-)
MLQFTPRDDASGNIQYCLTVLFPAASLHTRGAHMADKERVKSMIQDLKAALGREVYASFKATSLQFQHGKINAHAYYAVAQDLLQQHPGLLQETLETLPDEGKRMEVIRAHGEATALGRAPQQQPLPRPRGVGLESVMAPPVKKRGSFAFAAGGAGAGAGGGAGAGSGAGAGGDAGAGAGAGGGGSGGIGGERQSRAEVLAPGLVCLRRAIDLETQAWLADTAFRVGESTGTTSTNCDGNQGSGNGGCGGGGGNGGPARMGFYDVLPGSHPKEASVLRLNQGTRGRVILSIDTFPDKLRQLVMDCVTSAQAADPGNIPGMKPTTALVNFYKEGAQFKWHRDSEDPELSRTNRAPPIVSFSVGLSADFAYKRSFEDEKHDTVRLASGDVLLFGGPARMIVHSVTQVIPKTMPGMMRGKMLHGRLNVTVRDIGRGVIDTSMFPAYRVTYGGEEDTNDQL